MTRSKYGNRKVKADGYTFASQAEHRRYQQLVILERAGHIRGLKMQPVYVLQRSFKVNGKVERAIKYIGDFEYFDVETNGFVIEEVKGAETAVWKIKRKMMLFLYPSLELRVIAAKDV